MLKSKYEDIRPSARSEWIKKYFEYRVNDELIKIVFTELQRLNSKIANYNLEMRALTE
jgi:hypothetical protein